ncbi:MAG: prepilin-type N-terminal cleavage/methylation domain-containing protein [Patescibacteria group bacterium]
MLIKKDELTGNRACLPARQGQSLVEILIALTIFSLTISAVALMFFSGQSFVADSLQARKAIEKVHDGAEALRFIRDDNFPSMTDGLHGLSFTNDKWQLTLVPDWNDGFKRTVSISTDLEGIKHVDLLVQWNHPSEGTKSFDIASTIAPPNQGLTGDWTNPCVIGSADGGSGSKGTDVFYLDHKAYVTSSATASDKPDLFIFDVTSSTSPFLLGQLNIEQGVKSVAVAGTKAYVVEENSGDFFIVNVATPTAPMVQSKLTLNVGTKGRYVVTKGNYAYVTSANNSTGKEFFVINITNPAAPSVVASLELGVDINEISILGNTAYLATSSDTKELILFDITNPVAPVEIGNYNTQGTADGKSIYAKTLKRIYLGRNSSSDNELLILDASIPASITLRGSSNVSSSVFAVMSAGTQAFLGTDDTNEEFQNFDIKNPASIQQLGQINLSNIATGAAYDNNIVYMSVQNNDILQLISSCDDDD